MIVRHSLLKLIGCEYQYSAFNTLTSIEIINIIKSGLFYTFESIAIVVHVCHHKNLNRIFNSSIINPV